MDNAFNDFVSGLTKDRLDSIIDDACKDVGLELSPARRKESYASALIALGLLSSYHDWTSALHSDSSNDSSSS